MFYFVTLNNDKIFEGIIKYEYCYNFIVVIVAFTKIKASWQAHLNSFKNSGLFYWCIYYISVITDKKDRYKILLL